MGVVLKADNDDNSFISFGFMIMIMLNGDDGNDHIPYDNDDCKC